MRRQDFEANFAKAVGDYQTQTGREIDGETGVCSLIVLGSFTGAEIDYTSPPATTRESRALEAEKGLVRAEVFRSGIFIIDAIKTLLKQRKVSFHGLIAEGRIQTGLRHPETASHSIALAVDEARQPLGIVDSTAHGMFRDVEDATDAALQIQGRFLPHNPSLYLVLDEAGQQALRTPGRLVTAGDPRLTVSLMAPPR